MSLALQDQSYIVIFKDDASDEDIRKVLDDLVENGGQITQQYHNPMKGFAAIIPEPYLQELQRLTDNIIDFIEPDGIATTM